MIFLYGIYVVLFKKCYFCGKKFQWKDNIAINVNEKIIANSSCLEKNKIKNYFNKNVDIINDFDDSEFYG